MKIPPASASMYRCNGSLESVFVPTIAIVGYFFTPFTPAPLALLDLN
jgi:hypothetical protein